MRFNFQEIIA